jgi:hypothetical protein
MPEDLRIKHLMDIVRTIWSDPRKINMKDGELHISVPLKGADSAVVVIKFPNFKNEKQNMVTEEASTSPPPAEPLVLDNAAAQEQNPEAPKMPAGQTTPTDWSATFLGVGVTLLIISPTVFGIFMYKIMVRKRRHVGSRRRDVECQRPQHPGDSTPVLFTAISASTVDNESETTVGPKSTSSATSLHSSSSVVTWASIVLEDRPAITRSVSAPELTRGLVVIRPAVAALSSSL